MHPGGDTFLVGGGTHTHTRMHVQAYPSDERDTNTHSRPLRAPRGLLIGHLWCTGVMWGNRLGLNKRRKPDPSLRRVVWGCGHSSLSRGLMDGTRKPFPGVSYKAGQFEPSQEAPADWFCAPGPGTQFLEISGEMACGGLALASSTESSHPGC